MHGMQAIHDAEQRAREAGCDTVTIEHVLLALLAVPSVHEHLREQGVDCERAAAALEAVAPRGRGERIPSFPPLSPRLRTCFEQLSTSPGETEPVVLFDHLLGTASEGGAALRRLWVSGRL